jgi:hypothetical protein
MPQDRRILGYLAIVVSLLCCFPLACLSAMPLLLGVTALVNPSYYWKTNDTVIFSILGVISAVALLAGLGLAALGVRAVLSAAEKPTG